jgi:pyruvate kinase
VDWIALSFVQHPDDLDAVRAVMDEVGVHRPVLAKIEKPQALTHLDEIVERADGLMVARGDLGVEIPAEDVPHWQKHIIACCNHAGKPVVTATQMLDSMITNPRPTRAEASDVANAVLDGSDALMLSGETAAGAWPVEAVRTMARIIERAEAHQGERATERRRRRGRATRIATTGYAACQAAEMIGASALVSLTQSGSSARALARYRPEIPVFAVTADEATCNQLALVWGVTPLWTDVLGDTIEVAIDRLLGWLAEQCGLQSGASVVFTAGLPFEARCATNTIRLETIP